MLIKSICKSSVALCYFLLHREMQEFGPSALDTGKMHESKGK